ncbi:GerMN domain-containing protein [Paenibacillus doosanensis]|uniref:Spore germination protein GerM n=1 Tax=Paenibacillus konkukensis TaxID=2020716 RepID=A0ABY4RXH5_9BACL|nr:MULTISPECIES: GerMN domain-containing protein [Paenibacillus]MCS7458767.1 GerMN domain-containing protein [Paenibacillus doosanensis]UQZ86708.1 Spore germination protein GerM [Paenibacillus konkukensis]
MKQYRWTRWAAVTGIVVLLTSGCSALGTKEKSQSIDPPPTGADAGADTAKAVMAPAIQNPAPVTVYARDTNGLVAPVSLNVEKSVEVAKKALEAMVEDGPSASQLPAGFTALLPKGTTVKGINVVKDQQMAIVDFSKEFTDYNLQDERKILEAVTWTLTGFSAIDKVQIRVEGKDLKEMPVGGTPLDEPLSRAMGINLEKPEGVDYGQSTPVTLYFLGQNQDNYKYYVPVTRLVKRTDNVAQAVVEQLIAGPDEKKGLSAVMTPGAELKQVNMAGDVITVDFSDKVLGPDKKAPADALKAVVLSLTENEGAQTKVQITVNGDAKVSASDDQSYTKPVSRPTTINPQKM